MIAGWSQLTLKGKVLLAAGVALLLGALVVTLVLVRPRSAERPDAVVAPPAAGDRLLQSVTASLGSDGSIDQLGDTVVITRGKGGAFDTKSSAYDPSKAVDQLPVRVLASYRTEHSSGTDLADLKGYSGRVSIDVTVQNLTVKPQQVSYDAGGRSRTQTAMVGAPLTVVASASLPGVDPATVVTEPDNGAKSDVTNGVLGHAPDQTTQVQWATILAPPQLSAAATLRLVLDAKDLAVPTIDIGVQPGLVTDPSVGALVDSAFNPKNSSELALVSRTIDVVGDVNAVLTRASSQVSKVRKTLDSTSQTLGTKTVAALQADTKQLDSSLKQSDTNLNGLDKALKSSLKSTSSSTVQQLSDTVSQIDALLGDTSAKAPSVSVSGSGCAFQVKTPSAGDTVYGSLQQVTALLTAHASATGDCKKELQATITKTIGPADPETSDQCTEGAVAVTCTLANAQQTFVKVTDAIKAGQDASAKGLNPEEDFKASQQTVDTLTTQLEKIRDLTDKLGEDPDDPNAADETLNELRAELKDAADGIEAAQASLPRIKDQVNQVHDVAVTNKAEVGQMITQNDEAADKLCTLLKDQAQPGAPTAEQVNTIRAYLVTTPCPGTGAQTPPGVVAMHTRLDSQASAWDGVIKDTASTDGGVGKQLTDAESEVDKAATAIDNARTKLVDGQSDVGSVNDTAIQALADLKSLGTGLTTLQTTYTTTKSQLDTALADAAKQASENKLDPAIDQVSKQGEENSKQLGAAFENSAKGLSSAADALQKSGKKAVDQQRNQLAKTEKETTTSLSAVMTGSLDQISGDISSASRDLGSTRTQLTRDLANILLDLGNPRVKGSGVVGTLTKSADTARSADYQLALASDRTTSYGSVRAQDVAGIMLRQAQAEASFQRQAELPAFELDLPDSVQHRTVYTFHLAGGK